MTEHEAIVKLLEIADKWANDEIAESWRAWEDALDVLSEIEPIITRPGSVG